jgi:type IV pilus assembly protein PilY1
MKTKLRLQSAAVALAVASLTFFSGAHAGPLALSNVPLFLQESVAPLNMLVVGRDHKLYYEAYNDHSDLNGDGELDVGYKGYALKSPAPAAPESPYKIDYYGYFDSFKCYTYNSGGNRFDPASVTANKQCTNAWSGDFLNYLTMTRIDALRKVLYGGSRSRDDDSTTLQRSHVPQDAHSWGKEYNGLTDGYDIRKYAPLTLPGTGKRHLFANTTLLKVDDQLPRLRVLENQTVRIWNWVSIERPVAGDQIVTGVNATNGKEIRSDVSPTNYVVKVRVCEANLLEPNCQRYSNGDYKPIGLLQEFGEKDAMFFGLLSGTYAKNTSGGALRRKVGSITDEVSSSTGRFLDFDGIIRSLDRLRTTGFGNDYEYDCGSAAAGRPIVDGDCQMWGNPVAEMMYETMRYFAGKAAPTAAFSIAFGEGEESKLAGGGLPVATWDNPYKDRPVCTKPFETVISDVNTSYDTDQLPGVDSTFGSFTGDLSMNVATLGQTIWTQEFGAAGSYFIGQVGATTDGAPTPKTVSSFGNIRGLSPEEPTKRGGYYAASVANYGFTNDLNSADRDQKVSTFAVALASPLPKIEIPVAGRTITLAPFAKTVGGAFGITATTGAFQPTNQIVDFYVDSLTSTTGRFRVNFEDVEQGNDHDMDAIVVYDYVVNNNSTVTISLNSEYAAGSAIHHLGFVMSGTTADGIYLPVRDRDTAAANDPNYFLDTPNVAGALPLNWSQTFTPGTTGDADILKDPLWYAAKWGGFEDGNKNDKPDVRAEWDANNDGTPDNYFLVTNALKLSEQLRAAFDEILAKSSSASSASVNSGSVSSDALVYQAKFDSGAWDGHLLAYPINKDGTLGALKWDAANKVPTATTRSIITVKTDGTPIPFRWASLDDARKAQIEPTFAINPTLASDRLNYLRGDDSREVKKGGTAAVFRNRESKLGDIVASSPLFVGAPFGSYGATLESKPFADFRDQYATRTPVVYAGANDGMLHAFDATSGTAGGTELFAYIPGAAYKNLSTLSNPSYAHKYFVDSPPNVREVFFNSDWHTVLVGGLGGGGQSVYALDITDPSKFSETNATKLALWEFSDKDGTSSGITGDADLGYSYSQPAIVRLQTGKWAAIFGNGYNNTEVDGSVSTSGNAVLYIVDIETGKLIRKIDTLAGTTDDPRNPDRPNGLATPAVVDLNGDTKVDYVFAGDLFGNMWKFDIRDTDPTKWGVAFGTAAEPLPLFAALGSKVVTTPDVVSVDQAITSRPEIVRGPQGVGMMVLFGTGKYLETTDKMVVLTAPEIQTYYGLFDRNSGADTDRITARSQLTKQTILLEDSLTFGDRLLNVRATSQNALGANRGWYLDLLSPNGYKGERQVTNTTVRGSRVIFTTLIPDINPCNFGGGSWLMELDALSGGRLKTATYDLDGDGQFDGDDMVTVVIDGKNVKIPVSGLQPTTGSGADTQAVGIISDAGILFGDNATREFIYTPGTTGEIALTVGSADPRASGRQSWRQVR